LELLQLAAEGVLDSLGTRIDKSVLSVSASIGTLDGPTDPRRGFVVEPSLAVTAPAGITSIQYASADVRASAYLPLSSTVALAGRFGAGRLFPFGKSIPPSPDDAFVYYLRLRDVLFTAGGTRDVRGWDDRFLGPKFPQIVFTGVTEDSTLITEVDRYTPIGGFNRAHGTVEPRWTLPVLDGNLSAHAFLDAGKVWTSDPRFGEEGESSFEDLFWGTGAGINLATPVGALRVEVGYKLNPSLLDLVTAEDFARAILEEIPFDTLTRHQRRRFNLHIGLGTRL
ncbi:MAG: BamA/TamA family outer membrane protein, partial [Gemmatimonadota bacterium]